MEIQVVYNNETGEVEIDTGLTYLRLSKQAALWVANQIQDKIAKENIKQLRKDYKFEGNSL